MCHNASACSNFLVTFLLLIQPSRKEQRGRKIPFLTFSSDKIHQEMLNITQSPSLLSHIKCALIWKNVKYSPFYDFPSCSQQRELREKAKQSKLVQYESDMASKQIETFENSQTQFVNRRTFPSENFFAASPTKLSYCLHF